MRKELLDKVLSELRDVGDIEASTIVTRSGLLVTGEVPQKINAETFAAMAATMLGAAETITSEIEKEPPEKVIVETGEERIIIAGAGKKALLVCMTSEVNLDTLLVGVDRAIEKIERIL
jgi:hypothetical protein